MHRFLQYTLDLFEPLALADSTQHAPEIVAFIAPGVPHGEAQVLNRVIVPAVFTHPRANRELRLGDAQVAYLFQRAKRRTIGFVVDPDEIASFQAILP